MFYYKSLWLEGSFQEQNSCCTPCTTVLSEKSELTVQTFKASRDKCAFPNLASFSACMYLMCEWLIHVYTTCIGNNNHMPVTLEKSGVSTTSACITCGYSWNTWTFLALCFYIAGSGAWHLIPCTPKAHIITHLSLHEIMSTQGLHLKIAFHLCKRLQKSSISCVYC